MGLGFSFADAGDAAKFKVDRFVFPNVHRVVVSVSGRLLNLGSFLRGVMFFTQQALEQRRVGFRPTAGFGVRHGPSFLILCSFTNQV